MTTTQAYRLVQRADLFHMFSCDLAALAAPVSAPAAEGSLATLQQAKNVVFNLLKLQNKKL